MLFLAMIMTEKLSLTIHYFLVVLLMLSLLYDIYNVLLFCLGLNGKYENANQVKVKKYTRLPLVVVRERNIRHQIINVRSRSIKTNNDICEF